MKEGYDPLPQETALAHAALKGSFDQFLERFDAHEDREEETRSEMLRSIDHLSRTIDSLNRTLVQVSECPKHIETLYNRFWSLSLTALSVMSGILCWLLLNYDRLNLLKKTVL